MNRVRFDSCFAFLLLFLLDACATLQPTHSRSSPGYRRTLAHGIDALIADADRGLHIGIEVRRGDAGDVLYAHNANERFAPASTLKLFTGAAVLAHLGPTYRYTTDVRLESAPADGIVKRLYLRGSGDPSLSQWALTSLATTVRAMGVAAISDEIVIDDSAFESTPWGKGWMWDDLNDSFSAPISAINVDGNAFVMTITPGLTLGAPAAIVRTPNSAWVTVTNRITTGPAGSPRSVTASVRSAVEAPPETPGLTAGDVITLTGSLPIDAVNPAYKAFAVRDAASYAGFLWREALRAAGVRVGDKSGALVPIRRGKVPDASLLVAAHRSGEVGALLTEYMKASDNHGMECLLKTVGTVAAAPPGSWQNGLSAERAFLQEKVGLTPAEMSLRDGSGASRYSMVSPDQVGTLLTHLSRDFNIGPEFMASLPIGGLDGTLAERMVDPSIRGRVRAKTGTMTGVSNLAGYVDTPDHEVLTFAILIEGILGSSDPHRLFQEKIIAFLSNLPPE